MIARLLTTFLLAVSPVLTQAADVSVIVGGWSHHFLPASDRDSLNQTQGTLGLELSTQDWDLQASHQTDSFGCSSNQVSLSRLWELFQPRPWFSGGLLLGAVAAHRCTNAGGIVQISTPEYEPVIGFPPTNTTNCVSDPYQYPYTFCLYNVFSSQFQQPKPKWVYGILPGVYLKLGEWIVFETALVRSPWVGHHLVVYGQLSIKVFSF
jgi:hypothetical protein